MTEKERTNILKNNKKFEPNSGNYRLKSNPQLDMDDSKFSWSTEKFLVQMLKMKKVSSKFKTVLG